QRSDIFSLGAVLYEMCTGQPAFGASRRGELLDAVLNHEPPPVSRFTYEVPEELERIVRKCLAKRPEERYQDAADLLSDVRALRRRKEAGEVFPKPSGSGVRRRAWVWGGALAALALAFGGYVLLVRPRPLWGRGGSGPAPSAVAFYERGMKY